MKENFEEHFSPEQMKEHVERYEEMLRKKDQYFFDVDSFTGIIDYYFEKNEPVRAMQVVQYARSQHPFSVVFLLKEAQLHSFMKQYTAAFKAIDTALSLEPSDSEIFLTRGTVYSQIEKFEEAKVVTEPVYHKIVDGIQAKYAKFENVDKKELEALVGDIRKHWKVIAKDAKAKGGKSKSKK